MFSDSLSPIIAKQFLLQSFPLWETILFFALIMSSNFVQRNKSQSWLGWKLSQLSKGLTLSSHVEHFLPWLLRTSLKRQDKLVHGNLLNIIKRNTVSIAPNQAYVLFTNFNISIYFFYYHSHSSVKFYNNHFSILMIAAIFFSHSLAGVSGRSVGLIKLREAADHRE